MEPQRRIKVYFRGHEVGDYFADIVVNNLIILELKATENLVEEHENQLLHYLRSSQIEVGLLLNFGSDQLFLQREFGQLSPTLSL